MSSGSPNASPKDANMPSKAQLLTVPLHTYAVVEKILKRELEESEKTSDITGQQKISKNKAALVQKWVSRAITRVYGELQSRVSMLYIASQFSSNDANISDKDRREQNMTLIHVKENEKQSVIDSALDLSKEIALSREQTRQKMEEELEELEREKDELKKTFEDISTQTRILSKQLTDLKTTVIGEMQTSIISDVTENSKNKICYSPQKTKNSSSLVPAAKESTTNQDDNNDGKNKLIVSEDVKSLIAVNEGHELFMKNIKETIQTVNSLLEETPNKLAQYKETVESVKAFLSEKPSKLDELMSSETISNLSNVSENNENIQTDNQIGDNKLHRKFPKRRLSQSSGGGPEENKITTEQNAGEMEEGDFETDDHLSEAKKQKLQHERIISCLEDHLAFQEDEEELIDTNANSLNPSELLY